MIGMGILRVHEIQWGHQLMCLNKKENKTSKMSTKVPLYEVLHIFIHIVVKQPRTSKPTQ